VKPERWHRVEELYNAALELAVDERMRFLKDACRDDPTLYHELESLFSYEERDEQFINRPAFEVMAELMADENAGLLEPDKRIGKTISHFRVLERLGQGGMGIVFRAEDIHLGRQVALKFLPEETTDSQALQRLQREARAASSLNHPNICSIHEIGEHEGEFFIAMELLEGQSLDRRIGGHPLPLEECLTIGIQVTEALQVAHQKGIIHRDIKPANIFVTSQGQAKILDFGLAKLSSAATIGGEELEQRRREGRDVDILLSRTGVAMGTAGYMSPEQVRGEKLDARTDLFSFGLVLYEMATGHRAFEGDTGPALHNAILTQFPIPARQLNAEVPAKLGQIIAKALEKNRAARYQTVSDMRTDLEILKHETERRNPLGRWMLAPALVFVLLIVSVSWWFAKRQPPSTQVPSDIKFRQLTLNSSENPVRSGAISPNGKYLAYVDKLGIHVKDIGNGSIQDVKQPPDINNDSVIWEIMDVGWFPDNTRFLVNIYPASEDQGGWSSRIASTWVFSRTGEPRKLREHAIGWSVSPDGALIAFGTNSFGPGDRETWLMDSQGRQARKLFDTDENSTIYGFYWSADGQHALHFRTDASGDTLLSRDFQGGPPVALLTPAETKQIRGDISWLPDGRLIYQVGDADSALYAQQATCNFWTLRLDVHTGRPLEKARRLTNWTGFCNSEYANATADGKRLAFLRRAVAWTVYVADVEAGGTRIANMRHFTLNESTDFPQDWTNDSKQVVFVSDRTGKFAFYKQSLDEDTPQQISTEAGDFHAARLSPDGKWMFSIPQTSGDPKSQFPMMRIPLAGGSPELVTTIASGAGLYCARPPSSLCALAERTEDRKHLIFTSIDALEGRGPELARFDLDPGMNWQCDISPDGTRLAVSGNPHGPIHILSLRGHPEQVIPAKFNNLMGLFYWAADGKGLYVPDQTKRGTVLSYLDLYGKAHEVWVSPSGWAISARQSPDGRHLAILHSTATSNIWMMENF